jgi:6-pyruvoyl-tetrahydropterin synthase
MMSPDAQTSLVFFSGGQDSATCLTWVSGALKTESPATGMVVDLDDISSSVKSRVIEVLDHRHLNEVVDNPTCQRTGAWIWYALVSTLPQVARVILWKTRTSSATLRCGDPPARIAL